MKKPIYDWGNQHATIFDSYIHALDDTGIRYFILRNYEGLPEYNESKDIDLIIEPGKYKSAAQLLLNTFRCHGVEYYYVVKYERVRCWFGMNSTSDFAITSTNSFINYIHPSELFLDTSCLEDSVNGLCWLCACR